MAAERYLSRRIPDLRVGNNIEEIDKKLIPASIHPCQKPIKNAAKNPIKNGVSSDDYCIYLQAYLSM